MAIDKGHVAVAIALIDAGALIDITGENGKSALHYAMNMNAPPTMNLVISKLVAKNADINAEDIEGNTPLHYASKNRRADAIKFLVSQPGIKKNVKNKFNETPISLSANDILPCFDGLDPEKKPGLSTTSATRSSTKARVKFQVVLKLEFGEVSHI